MQIKTASIQPTLKRTALASALALALALGFTINLPKSTAEPANTPATIEASPQFGLPNFADLVQQVKPAVVNIAITGTTPVQHRHQAPQFPEHSPFNELFKHFFQGQPGLPGPQRHHPSQEFRAVGSGFFISADGYLITNYHVIEHAKDIQVILQDGNQISASIQGYDQKTDLALLKVDSNEPQVYVELGNSDQARVGEWVVAVGNPFGLGGTVTAGIISARGRDIQSGPYDDYLQVDAPINRGNSGGPLFDDKGQVIGINTAIYSPTGGSVGIGFAIPSNLAKDIVAQLKDTGSVERGWLGVQIQPVTLAVAESLGLKDERGALVSSVTPGGPAEKAGVVVGDIIISLDGEKLETYKDLSKLVARTEAGHRSKLKVIRQGESRNLKVTIGRLPTEQVAVAQSNTDSDDQAKLGIYLSRLTPETRQRFRIPESAGGVLVTGTQPGSPAQKAGIRPGSLISMVGQESVNNPNELINKVQSAARNDKPSVLLLVEDRQGKRFVVVEFT